MDPVQGIPVVVLQMHEPAGELDQGLVINMPLATGADPHMLEHVVRRVVGLRVEEPEIFEIAGVMRGVVRTTRAATRAAMSSCLPMARAAYASSARAA